MPPKEKEREPPFQIREIILLVAAVTGGVWFSQNPLVSSRPVQGTEIIIEKTMGDERVSARLWQDPFEAVETHVKAEESQGSARTLQGKHLHSHSLSLLATEVATSVPTPRAIQILIVLTDGSFYADNRESRLRQRYAVLAGLERAGYTPRDGEHIRYFDWEMTKICRSMDARHGYKGSHKELLPQIAEDADWEVSSIKNGNCQKVSAEHWLQAPVPLEWYESLHDSNAHVLVLWIKDQDLGSKPLDSLRIIQRATLNAFPLIHATISVKVIGPRFSGTLQTMLVEDDAVDGEDPLEIYSPWSTAPEEFLLSNREKSVNDQFIDRNVTFIRTIPTDDLLIHALVDELKRRGVSVSNECSRANTCDHIAVLAEWDTLYGRALPKIFSAVATNTSATTERYLPPNELVKGDAKQVRANRIHRFSYLRGLDGELPQDKPNRSSDEKTSSSRLLNERRQDIDRLERPEERSQLDYVRRLAQHLRDIDDELRAQCGLWKSNCPGFKAIGVLGSDVYDKMLILQALKKSFPQAIFFTTDLDARLFHPTQLMWTRNLVVASHFDLGLNPMLQGEIPPFRDTYQAATMATILRALGRLKETTECPEALQFSDTNQNDCFAKLPQTKLHELGRNGPVDISIKPASFGQAQLLQTVSTVRPAPLDLEGAIASAFFVIACFIIIVILLIPASVTIFGWVVQPFTDQTTASIKTALKTFASGFVLIVLALACLLPYVVSDSYEGEPFSIFDGVSIWPSQILRGTAVILSVLFACRLCQDPLRICNDLNRQFSRLLNLRELPPNPVIPIIDYLMQWIKTPEQGLKTAISQMYIGQWALDTTVKTSEIVWQEYQERLHRTWLIMRVLFWSVTFYIAGWMALALNGLPFTPFRGQVSEAVNSWLLKFAVLGMIGVIFLVLDITRLTSVFVRKFVPENLDPVAVSPLPRLQLIAQLTDQINKFIYYPASLLALMVMARSDVIDNWDFPVGLMVVIGLSAFYVVVSAVQLRRASEIARTRVIDSLSTQYLSMLPSDSADKIQQTIEEVKLLSKGAFMPVTELPVFRAVTLPTGAYALLSLIETIAKN